MKLMLLNGPNLNLLGTREPDVYGSDTLADLVKLVSEHAAGHGIEITATQSNVEGELVNALHDARDWADGVIFNPGGYTHYSVALRDAISAIELPVIEVHMSNVQAREDFRHESVVGAVCLGTIAGFGVTSYRLAVDAMADHLDQAK